MTVVCKVLLFLLGMTLAVQVVGALFAFVDLRGHRKGRLIVRAVTLWCVLGALPALFLGPVYRPAYLWGLALYGLVYILSFLGGQLMIRRNRRLIARGLDRP